ncbi:uncharacterized protein LOC122262614 [Penaeus japonicus]|uniref:uncharacterized protein LOC122262614 n=1 Tax=Penaeus japonicus TaxID=27405 RepID=UPI001C70C63C|nr:uncharacterized protein LOC122262614 [Penaeus japonicus]
MSLRGTDHTTAGGGALYPELVDGRVEDPALGSLPTPFLPSGGPRTHARRSNSLLPESLSVRRARNSLKRRRLGFTAVVLPDVQGQAGHSDDLAAAFGHDPPSGSSPSTPQRRASVHKLLSGTFSDPMSAHERRVVSSVSIQMSPSHDDCSPVAAAHNPPLTPRRSHSFRLLSHAHVTPRGASGLAKGGRSLVVAFKQDHEGFKEEGLKESGEVRNPAGGFKDALGSSEAFSAAGGTEGDGKKAWEDECDNQRPKKEMEEEEEEEEKKEEEEEGGEGKKDRTSDVGRSRTEIGSESGFLTKDGVAEDNGNDVTEEHEAASVNELSESVTALKVSDL